MKHCPNCDTYSVAGDDICLNCNTRWIEVTEYKIGRRGWAFLIMLVISLAYCGITSWLWLYAR